MSRRGATTIAVCAVLTGLASAQENAKPAASVTLDQLSTPSARTGSGSIDQAMPPQPSRAAAVTGSDVSTRADGRAVVTTPLVGIDRCDPAGRGPRAAACRRRIETRANDYTRPRPAPVTAEGRLLLLVGPNGGAVGQPGTGSTVDGPNGPGAQLAGALQSQADAQAASNGTATLPSTPLPAGVPPIIILPNP